MKLDIAIIGGGILGVSLAYHLCQQKHQPVLIERETGVGHHASGRNAGMIRHLQDHPLLEELVSRSVSSWPNEIRDLSFLSTPSSIRTAAGHKHDCGNDGLLDSSAFVQGVAQLARQAGTKLLLSANVASVKQSRFGSWLISLSDSRVLLAEKIVIAGGAWSEELARSIYHRVGLSPPFALHSLVRELSVVHGFEESLLSERNLGFDWDEQLEIYMRHWSTDERIVSGCEALSVGQYQQSSSASLRERLAEKLTLWLNKKRQNGENVINDISKLSLGRSWHCLRTFTGDERPLVGKDCIFPGLYWATGFGGFGMSTGFAAMADLAEEIVSDEKVVPLEFRSERFFALPDQDHAATTVANVSFS